jgi:hypothetical protein
VTLASTGEFHRPPLSVRDGNKLDYDNRDSWCPGRETVVFIGSVAFGLSFYETTDEVEVRHDWNGPIRYIRVSTVPTKRRRGWAGIDTTYKKHTPSGRLAVRAYCPYVV